MVVGRAFRVVFFGTPAFAVPTLDALLSSQHQVVGIVSQPDRPSGRGQRTAATPTKARAVAAALPVLQPDKLKSPAFLQALAELTADIGVVAAYGRILNDAVLGTPAMGMLNVHASLLPRYRGAAPVHRAVIAGELETGVTIMRVVSDLDAGPMLAVAHHPIGPDDTSLDVELDLAQLGARLLVSTLDRLAVEPVREEPQVESLATYAPRLTKADGSIQWSSTAAAIHNVIRGLHPWPHAYTFLKDRRIILLRSSVIRNETGAAPGTILRAHGDQLEIATGQGILGVLELQAEGRRPMPVREFLAGRPIAPLERFAQSP